MNQVNILQPLSFPLQGQQLIEASAGTGKTYTITALYLRLLLGMGECSNKPLGPEQILVVTFTEAATEELRDRIRVRIVEARQALLTEPVKDPFLADLKRALPDLDSAVRLLEQAVRQMDEAAIFTIHGFCQRMLKRHAFESGALFDNELTQDDQSLLRSAVLDFWRSSIYPLGPELVDLIFSQCWSSPEQLISELRPLLGRCVRLEPDLTGQTLEQSYQARKQQVLEFKQAWLANSDDLVALIQASGINKSSYKKNLLPKWIEQIDDYAHSTLLEPDKKLVEVMTRFTPDVLAEKTKTGEPPHHPLFDRLAELLPGAVPVREILLGQALQQVEQRLNRVKKQQQLQTFDDLLSNLNRALLNEYSSALAEAIRQQFPVAMIDEFQDTDPLQYGIFSRLYSDPVNSALIMIGDPKQAIYAFRGADIFTYIQARRSVAESFTLDTNWRSTKAMVEAVNCLFQFPQNAFIYDEDIPFHPVKAAAKQKHRLTIQEREPAALSIWYQEADKPLNKEQTMSVFAQATAAEIDRLLCGDARIGDKPVQGADIAVLVKNRYEAEEVRRALAQYEHPCVYLSNQDSVFNSQEALELVLILSAVENPQAERGLRAALATELMQLDMLSLDALNRDERAWDQLITEFSYYREVWLESGLLPMLNGLLQKRGLAVRYLQQPGGERRLTNLLHMGELLQQASTELEGISGLLRWFNEQIANAGSGADEQILRLESERNLVTIVTVHKSKGLEYPIVFLPFSCIFREQKSAFYHDQNGEAVLNISAEESALAQADQERLAEDLRLLYVALTRSVYRCYLGVSDLRIGNSPRSRLEESALGYLLLQSGISLDQALQQLADSSEAIELLSPPNHGAQKDMFSEPAEPAEHLQALQFAGRIDRGWRVSSYSALSRHSSSALPELPGLDLEVAAERSLAAEERPEGENIFTFPKGANAGTFLHSVFEEISFNRYHSIMAEGDQYREQIAEQLNLAGYDLCWQPVIEQLINDVLQRDLDGQGLRLADLEDADRLVEMEFMLSADQVRVAQLESLIRRYDPLSARAAPLSFEPLRGMHKGFIDLLFRSNGRYYVLDYKSNHLGYEVAAYSRAAMEQGMIEHRYDLQYLLYTLAVHRLLRQRVPDYDYERHFGGVFYLFLRGIDQERDSVVEDNYGVFSCRPEKALIEQLDQLFAGEVIDV